MSESNVVSIGGGPVILASPPSEALVAALEDLLEKARSGEVIGGACIYQYRDSATGAFSCGVVGYSMLGRLMCMTKHLVEQVDGQ